MIFHPSFEESNIEDVNNSEANNNQIMRRQHEQQLCSQNSLDDILKNARNTGVIEMVNYGLNDVPSDVWYVNSQNPRKSQTATIGTTTTDNWWNMVALRKLVISYNKISYISSEIRHLSKLTYLDLHCNNICFLPEEIGSLVELSYLNIGENYLKNFPRSIGKLQNLTHLVANNNQIEEFSYELCKLSQLIVLNLSHNNLSQLPKSISQLKKIEKLQLNNNQLNSLPQEFNCFFALKYLNVSDNSLTRLPQMFFSNSALQELYANNNSLQVFPELYNCTNLTTLELHTNNIRNFTVDNIMSIVNIVNLDISNNKMKEIPPEINNLYRLMKLDVSRNLLKDLPVEIGSMDQLKVLMIYGNQFVSIKKDILQHGAEEIKEVLRNRCDEYQYKINSSIILKNDMTTSNSRYNQNDMQGSNHEKYLPSTFESGKKELQRQSLLPNNRNQQPPSCQSKKMENNFKPIEIIESPIFPFNSDSHNLLENEVHVNANQYNSNSNNSNDNFNVIPIKTNIEITNDHQHNFEEKNHSTSPTTSTPPSPTTTTATSGKQSSYANHHSTSSYQNNPTVQAMNNLSLLTHQNETQIEGPVLTTAKGIKIHKNVSHEISSTNRFSIQELIADGHTVKYYNKIHTNDKELPDYVWNQLKCLPVTSIITYNNGWPKFPTQIFHFWETLQEINLSSNYLREIPEEISCLSLLRTLKLANNNLTDLPESILQCSLLHTIDMSYNPLTEIPPVIYQMMLLNSFSANHCRITEIDPKSLMKMINLRALELQSNEIASLPPELGLCDQLTCLRLETNPFRIPRPHILAKGTEEILDYLRRKIQF